MTRKTVKFVAKVLNCQNSCSHLYLEKKKIRINLKITFKFGFLWSLGRSTDRLWKVLILTSELHAVCC